MSCPTTHTSVFRWSLRTYYVLPLALLYMEFFVTSVEALETPHAGELCPPLDRGAQAQAQKDVAVAMVLVGVFNVAPCMDTAGLRYELSALTLHW